MNANLKEREIPVLNPKEENFQVSINKLNDKYQKKD